MALIDKIPMPEQPGEAFAGGTDIFNNLMKTPLERQKLSQEALANAQLNKYRMGELGLAQQELPSKIALHQAMKQYYEQGGGGIGSVGSKDINAARAYIMQNRGISAKEADEIINKGLSGDATGLSNLEKKMIENIASYKTPAALITQGVRGSQAEAEMPILDAAISEGREPYGDTVFGQSWQHYKDMFNTKDEAAQTRIGNYIASDVLNFDKAALQAKMAGTESGVTILNEVMDKAKQTIKAQYPMLTDKARQVALEKVSSTLKKALKARQSINLSAIGAMGGFNQQQETNEKNSPTDNEEKKPEKKREVWSKDKNGNPILVSK